MTQDSTLTEYLKVLAPYIGLTLRIDENGVCRLKLRDNLSCQIQASMNGGFQLTAVLGELPSGRFRQQVMLAALRFNGGSPPPYSVLSFSQKHSTLILQLELPAGTDEEKIRQQFTLFLELSVQWQDALRAGGGYPEPSTILPSMQNLNRSGP